MENNHVGALSAPPHQGLPGAALMKKSNTVLMVQALVVMALAISNAVIWW